MPKIIAPFIPANIATKAAPPGVTQATLRDALWDIENQRREGKTDAHEALKTVFTTVETQRKAG
jgi:hypothetical protein